MLDVFSYSKRLPGFPPKKENQSVFRGRTMLRLRMSRMPSHQSLFLLRFAGNRQIKNSRRIGQAIIREAKEGKRTTFIRSGWR